MKPGSSLQDFPQSDMNYLQSGLDLLYRKGVVSVPRFKTDCGKTS
jgi:hypothetical protein